MLTVRAGVGELSADAHDTFVCEVLAHPRLYCEPHLINAIDLFKDDMDGHDMEVVAVAYRSYVMAGSLVVQFEHRCRVYARHYLEDALRHGRGFSYRFGKVRPLVIQL